MSQIMTIDGIEIDVDDDDADASSAAMGNLGDTSTIVSSVATAVVEQIGRDPMVQRWLRALGRQFADEAINRVVGAVSAGPEPFAGAEQMLKPLLRPFMEGVEETVTRRGRPWITWAALLGGGLLVTAGLYVGKRKRQLYARGRADAARGI